MSNLAKRQAKGFAARKALTLLVALLAAAFLAAPASAEKPRFTADFTFSPQNPTPGEQVTFTSTSTVVGNSVHRQRSLGLQRRRATRRVRTVGDDDL